MKSNLPFQSQKGFTLIEVMVVIVIMTLMTSLVVLNIGGVDQKKSNAGERVIFTRFTEN